MATNHWKICYSVWALLACLIMPDTSLARRAKTIAFIADPSCRTSKLVPVIEQSLEENLKVKNLVVQQKERNKAQILLQYFLIERKQGDEVRIQLDGRAFANRSGKLLAESTMVGELFPYDDNGRQAAAKQCAAQLAEKLSGLLDEALWAKGRGRRVMLQVSLDEHSVAMRQRIVDRLKQALSGSSPVLKGSTERNLVLVFKSSERVRDLVDLLGPALTGKDQLKIRWLVETKNTLMATLAKD